MIRQLSFRKLSLLLVISLLLLTSPLAGVANDVEPPRRCVQCGMDRAAFSQSRMLVEYGDGSSAGVCSLHCAAVQLQMTGDKKVTSLLVADYVTHTMLDARSAVWVTGGKKPGVMTSFAKWAFARMDDARSFVEQHGGVLTPFDQALRSATVEVMEQAAEERAVQQELHEGMP